MTPYDVRLRATVAEEVGKRIKAYRAEMGTIDARSAAISNSRAWLLQEAREEARASGHPAMERLLMFLEMYP